MYVPFLHFNPRIREGCDIADIRVFNRNIVLIHAPVKGATGLLGLADIKDGYVLIHAPVKGATKAVM